MAFVFGCLAFKASFKSSYVNLISAFHPHRDLSLVRARGCIGKKKAQLEAFFRIVCRSKVVPFFRGARQGRALKAEE